MPGTRLPAAREGDRLWVDWSRAAVEARPAGPFDFDAFLHEGAQPDGTIGDMDEWMAEFDKWKR